MKNIKHLFTDVVTYEGKGNGNSIRIEALSRLDMIKKLNKPSLWTIIKRLFATDFITPLEN